MENTVPNHTPPMTNPELGVYLENHLNNELQWLLRAASEWHVQDKLQLKIVGYSVQVYAMDSAFLHARTLFEFFTQRTSPNYYGCDAFHINIIPSPIYTTNWKDILHSYLMHAQNRSNPRQLASLSGGTSKDLNKMPVDFAKEIIRLWQEFIKLLKASSDTDIQDLAIIATDKLDEAKANTLPVFNNPMVKRLISSISW